MIFRFHNQLMNFFNFLELFIVRYRTKALKFIKNEMNKYYKNFNFIFKYK